MGHATKIANHIIESMEKGQNSEKIKGYFEGMLVVFTHTHTHTHIYRERLF